MANEAIVTIIARMKDEASPKMKGLGETTQKSDINMREFKMTLTAVGSAFTSVGSLIGRIDNPLAKLASDFLLTGGAIISTASAVMWMIPNILKLISTLRALAVTQAIVKALSGPSGWAQLGIGLAVGTAAYVGTTALMNSAGGQAQVVNINTAAFMGNDSDARKFSRKMQTISREDTRIGR